MHWLYLLTVQGTLKSLLQHHRTWPVSKGELSLKYGIVSFYGLGNFIAYRVGGLFQLFMEEEVGIS